jgi:hypothetical protein
MTVVLTVSVKALRLLQQADQRLTEAVDDRVGNDLSGTIADDRDLSLHFFKEPSRPNSGSVEHF